MVGAIAATVAVVASLLRPPPPPAERPRTETAAVTLREPVRVLARGLLFVDGDTPLQKELATTDIHAVKISRPILSVSGSILARIHQGAEALEDRWQFSTPELSTPYADWLRAKNDIEFAESQLTKTKELADAETSFLETNVKRLEPLVSSSTVPEKDFRQAKSALLKAQLQGEKDIFAAQSALRVAVKQKTATERDLSRGGIESVVFSRAVEHMVLVAANVPEANVSQVREGQACEVRFYGYPNLVFPAHVEAMGSSLTQERRTLRVLFEMADDRERLKPGMFAEVGLGTEERDAILISATSLLHIGRNDYVLAAGGVDQWRVVEVKVGEVQHGQCEVLEGLTSGEKIISRGAILLKAVAGQALALPERVVENP